MGGSLTHRALIPAQAEIQSRHATPSLVPWVRACAETRGETAYRLYRHLSRQQDALRPGQEPYAAGRRLSRQRPALRPASAQ